jgi:4-hydroxybenzoate polyprenyltransferase
MLASKQLSVTQALAFLVPNLAVGLAVVTQLNTAALFWAFFIIPVATLYPLSKRYFKYPQLVLGIAFNWGVFVGSAAVDPTKAIISLPLFLSGISWTLIYDTIYAIQDRHYDKSLQINSTAIAF